MKIATLAVTAATMAMMSGVLFAQSYTLDKYPPPLNANDAFVLDVSHPVVVGKHVLGPGRYHFERLDIAGSDLPVLTIRSVGDNAKTLNIAAMIEPAFKNSAPAETYATYHHIGDRYYFDQIFIRGLNYGYKFELPKDLRKSEQ